MFYSGLLKSLTVAKVFKTAAKEDPNSKYKYFIGFTGEGYLGGPRLRYSVTNATVCGTYLYNARLDAVGITFEFPDPSDDGIPDYVALNSTMAVYKDYILRYILE
jgi:hypothetical protein